MNIDFNRLKDLKQRNIITEESYTQRVLDFAKIFLETNMKLEILHVTGMGTYGGKIIVKEKGSKVKLEVKVVIDEKCPKQYVEIWPSLKHSNILRLLDMQYISRADTHVFMTEYYFWNLENFLQSDVVIQNRNSPIKVKRLLSDILGGLKYLHDRGYSHLVLKRENILISRENSAIISNFTSLGPAGQIPESTKVPLNYGPPELYFRKNYNINVHGAYYDIWSFGILALNVLTNGYIRKKIPEYADWCEKVYPTLFKILQMRKFSKYIQKAFPVSKINEASKKVIINFIITCLRIIPAERPPPDMLLKHNYFMEDGGFITVHNKAWYKKCNYLDFWKKALNLQSSSSNESTSEEALKENEIQPSKRNGKESRKESNPSSNESISENTLEENEILPGKRNAKESRKENKPSSNESTPDKKIKEDEMMPGKENDKDSRKESKPSSNEFTPEEKIKENEILPGKKNGKESRKENKPSSNESTTEKILNENEILPGKRNGKESRKESKPSSNESISENTLKENEILPGKRNDKECRKESKTSSNESTTEKTLKENETPPDKTNGKESRKSNDSTTVNTLKENEFQPGKKNVEEFRKESKTSLNESSTREALKENETPPGKTNGKESRKVSKIFDNILDNQNTKSTKSSTNASQISTNDVQNHLHLRLTSNENCDKEIKEPKSMIEESTTNSSLNE